MMKAKTTAFDALNPAQRRAATFGTAAADKPFQAGPLLMRAATTTLRVGFEPGTKWLYSNIGYVLLGFLLESIEKRAFAEIMRRRVLDPLGMNRSVPVISAAIRDRTGWVMGH